jgi:hypothetical protein
MPYRHGHYYVGFTLLVILTGFWASYFAPLRTPMPLAFHVHAVTASTWLLLLIAQSVAIHRRQNALHKVMGKASFALFPLLILGFTMIINLAAARYAAKESEFIAYIGGAFGIGMAVAIAAYLTLFYQALKHRRNARLHAGYMLATPMILFESPFSRAMDQYFPWMNVIGSPGIQGLLDTIVVSNALVTLFALALYLRDRKHGAPWLVAIGFMTLQSITMWFAPGWPLLGDFFAAYARVPDGITLAGALLAGAAAGYFGWHAAPCRRKRTAPDEALPQT